MVSFAVCDSDLPHKRSQTNSFRKCEGPYVLAVGAAWFSKCAQRQLRKAAVSNILNSAFGIGNILPI